MYNYINLNILKMHFHNHLNILIIILV